MSASRLRWWGLGIIALGCFFGGGWLLRRGFTRLPGPAAAPVPGTQLFQQALPGLALASRVEQWPEPIAVFAEPLVEGKVLLGS